MHTGRESRIALEDAGATTYATQKKSKLRTCYPHLAPSLATLPIMKNLKFSLLVAAASSALMTASLPAATQNWFNAGPSNDWSTTAGNWDGGSVWTQNNSAIFGGTGETVTLTGPITADDLTFT